MYVVALLLLVASALADSLPRSAPTCPDPSTSHHLPTTLTRSSAETLSRPRTRRIISSSSARRRPVVLVSRGAVEVVGPAPFYTGSRCSLTNRIASKALANRPAIRLSHFASRPFLLGLFSRQRAAPFLSGISLCRPFLPRCFTIRTTAYTTRTTFHLVLERRRNQHAGTDAVEAHATYQGPACGVTVTGIECRGM